MVRGMYPVLSNLINMQEEEDMKKGILVAFLAIGFIFTGVISASAGAVTWNLVQDPAWAGDSPDPLLCTGATNNGTKCNMDVIKQCASVGNPTSGTCSFAQLTFQMASSCGAGLTGQSCTQNTDCGSTLTPCVPCAPNPGVTYFGTNPVSARGAGTYTTLNCDNTVKVTGVAIGTSEVVSHVGGSCMTMAAFNSASGCGVGSHATDYDLQLWTSTTGSCGYNAGVMPGLSLSGQIMATGSPVAACGYTAPQLASIVSTAGLGGYLAVLCGSGTLPTLSSVCISGAPWQSTIIANASYNPTSECPAACPQGCTGAAAEGIE